MYNNRFIEYKKTQDSRVQTESCHNAKQLNDCIAEAKRLGFIIIRIVRPQGE